MSDGNTTAPGKFQLNLWRIAFLVCALACLGILCLLPPETQSFSDRAIGIAVITDSNVHYRLYVYILALVVLIALSCMILLGRPLKSNPSVKSREESLAWLLVSCGALNILAWILLGNGTLFLGGGLLALFLSLVWIARAHLTGTELEADVFVSAICLSWQGTTIAFMLYSKDAGASYWAIWIAILIGLLASHRLGGWYRASRTRPLTRMLGSGLSYWLLLAPLLYIAAAEIHHFTSAQKDALLSPAAVFGLLSGLTVVACTALRGRRSPSACFGALTVLLSTIALIEYDAIIQYNFYDMFHLGEKILPLQQWRSFGLLPFVDYMPTHGLADTFPQSLYQWLRDGEHMEAMIWGNGHFMGWFTRTIAIALLYAFLSRLLPPITAFFLIWLLPTYHIFEPYYTWLFLPAIHILSISRYQRRWLWWLVQWLLTLGLFLWRLDFGIASAVASLALAVLLAWNVARWSELLESVASAFVVAAAALTLYYVLAPPADFARHLTLIGTYMSNQIPLVSFSEFYREVNYPFVLQYLVLPAISAVIFAYSLAVLVQRRGTAAGVHLDLLIVYLGAVTLILSVRSLQRHSLLSGDFNVYLHLVLIVIVLVRYLPTLTRSGSPALLACFTMGTYLLLPTAEDFLHRAMYHPPVAREYPVPVTKTTFPEWRPDQPRLIDNVERYNDIVEFMRESLTEGQTFYDFSNAPLLYALADVELPVFIPQTAYQSSRTIQRATVDRLQGLHKAGRLPFVVFRQGNAGWDQLDGVDNALRSYLIAEFIYRHYTPCLRLDSFDLWVDRDRVDATDCVAALRTRTGINSALTDRTTPLVPGYLEQFIDFRSLPERWARLDTVSETLSARSLTARPRGSRRVELHASGRNIGCGDRACYLDLTMVAAHKATASIEFLGGEHISFTVYAGKRHYRIRISALWHWYRADSIDSLEVAADTTLQVKSAAIVTVD